MPRSRWLAAAATMTALTACFTDLGTDSSGVPSSSAASTSDGTSTGPDPTSTTTTGTTTTGTTTTTNDTTSSGGPLTSGPGTSLDTTGSNACGDGVLDPGEECDDANMVDGDGCDPTCHVSSCGNGVVEGSEECDEGDVVDGDGCDACVRKFFHVFVTSSTHTGDLGGVAGGDQICQDRAAAAGLPGRYYAWLAASGNDEPAARFTQSFVPYYLPDRQTIVADDFAGLLTGLLHAINQTEKGTTLAVNPIQCHVSRLVWTGLDNNGSASTEDCGNWTALGDFGDAGYLDDVDNWSNACAIPCDPALRLYCFQQGP